MFEVKIISLKSQEKRRKHMADLFDKSDVNWSFFDAVPGVQVDPYLSHYDQKQRRRFPGHDMTRNEIACFISHREVWKLCAEAGHAFVVLEDDAYVLQQGCSVDSLKVLMEDFEKIPHRDCVIRLGHGGYKNEYHFLRKLSAGFSLVRYQRDPLCALAYVITPSVAKKLIKNSEKFFLAVDDYLWNGNESGVFVLDIEPVLFSAAVEGNPSTIGERKKEKMGPWKKLQREFFRFFFIRKQREFEKKAVKVLKEY